MRRAIVYKWVMSYYINESCYIIWMSCLTYSNDSCHIYEWVASRTYKCHVIYMTWQIDQDGLTNIQYHEKSRIWNWYLGLFFTSTIPSAASTAGTYTAERQWVRQQAAGSGWKYLSWSLRIRAQTWILLLALVPAESTNLLILFSIMTWDSW